MEKEGLRVVFELEIIILIIIASFGFCWIKYNDLLIFNCCCLTQERRQFHQQHSRDCGGTGVSPSCLDCWVEKLRRSAQSPHSTSTLCHPMHIPSPKMKRGTHQFHQVWWYSMPSRRWPSSSNGAPCQHHGPPSPAPENSHSHLDANCICVHYWTLQSPRWWREDAAVGTRWISWGTVLKWERRRNTNLTNCFVRDVCVRCMCDVWWVLGHSGITLPLMGPMGTYTYGCVAPDEGNLNKQCLVQPECVNWPKTVNV